MCITKDRSETDKRTKQRAHALVSLRSERRMSTKLVVFDHEETTNRIGEFGAYTASCSQVPTTDEKCPNLAQKRREKTLVLRENDDAMLTDRIVELARGCDTDTAADQISAFEAKHVRCFASTCRHGLVHVMMRTE